MLWPSLIPSTVSSAPDLLSTISQMVFCTRAIVFGIDCRSVKKSNPVEDRVLRKEDGDADVDDDVGMDGDAGMDDDGGLDGGAGTGMNNGAGMDSGAGVDSGTGVDNGVDMDGGASVDNGSTLR